MVTPFEQGETRGKSEKKAIIHTLSELKRAADFLELREGSFSKIEKDSLKYVPARYIEECEGIAKGCGLEEEGIFSINFGKGLRHLFIGGCTAFVVPKTHTPDGSTLLSKNRDLGYRRLHPQVLAYSKLDGYNEFLGVVNGGSINWYQGVNDKGLVAFNTATRGEPYEEGMPISVLIRRVLEECDSVDECLKFIENNSYEAHSNLIFTDREKVAIVEVKSGYPTHVWDIDKPECRTNHYLFHSNPDANTKENVLRTLQTQTRYERGKQLLKGKDKIGLEDLKTFSRDHDHGPGSYSICRHAAFVGTPIEKILSSSTLSSQIFRLEEEIETHVALGRPCQTEFVQITFGQPIPASLASGEPWLRNLRNKEG